MKIVSIQQMSVKRIWKMRQTRETVSPICNEARTAYTIEHITEALFRLLKEKPISEISINELCTQASVGRASFYRNFTSREDVLKKWLDKVTDEFVSDSAISLEKDSSTEYFTKLLAHMIQYKEVCSILNNAGLTQLLKDEFDRRFLLSYQETYGRSMAYFLSGGIFNIILLWLTGGCRETPEEIAAGLEEILRK